MDTHPGQAGRGHRYTGIIGMWSQPSHQRHSSWSLIILSITCHKLRHNLLTQQHNVPFSVTSKAPVDINWDSNWLQTKKTNKHAVICIITNMYLLQRQLRAYRIPCYPVTTDKLLEDFEFQSPVKIGDLPEWQWITPLAVWTQCTPDTRISVMEDNSPHWLLVLGTSPWECQIAPHTPDDTLKSDYRHNLLQLFIK